MTAYPIPENAGHWWLTTRISWDRLHAVPLEAVDPDDEDACEALRSEFPVLAARCGMTASMAWPGLSSRYGLPRCAHCCRVLGIPAGVGTPCNEQGLAEQQRAARSSLGPPGVVSG